ncbi:hypothetical protein BKA70DRAFT_1231336 [Coprinopsis sp. MPI-PUGE-AT-0042]|nr:hypothetical protein BKA70DRAFT_1231336 [Coprinopsis sp. MPI-PUGE-AT-0042]
MHAGPMVLYTHPPTFRRSKPGFWINRSSDDEEKGCPSSDIHGKFSGTTAGLYVRPKGLFIFVGRRGPGDEIYRLTLAFTWIEELFSRQKPVKWLKQAKGPLQVRSVQGSWGALVVPEYMRSAAIHKGRGLKSGVESPVVQTAINEENKEQWTVSHRVFRRRWVIELRTFLAKYGRIAKEWAVLEPTEWREYMKYKDRKITVVKAFRKMQPFDNLQCECGASSAGLVLGKIGNYQWDQKRRCAMTHQIAQIGMSAEGRIAMHMAFFTAIRRVDLQEDAKLKGSYLARLY